MFGNTYINMKRYYTGLDFILSWLFILLLAIGGFIFECIDRGGFIIFAFITSFFDAVWSRSDVSDIVWRLYNN